ncbi:Protease HtpX [Moorella thermoacetica]|uniref:M48 family metallopeptidase n=1 Tax=Neomoorella thermoacetica TaxID=1525 RepID=UPI0030CD98B6
MLDVSSLRHEKERIYLIICMLIGGIVWFALIWVAWLLVIPVVIISWLFGQYFKAYIYGNAIRVSQEQFKEIHEVVKEMTRELNIAGIPDVFILSGQGNLNSLAVNFLSGRYILLYGELVDLSLKRDAHAELRMIIGHELAHHALGHVNLWRNLLLLPSKIIPFLGGAYSRACELSADRVGMALARDGEAARKALLALTVGSEALAAELDTEAFIAQEKYIPPVMGFIYELYSSHPRMSVRISELKKYEKNIPLLFRSSMIINASSTKVADTCEKTAPVIVEPAEEIAVASQQQYCSSCGQVVLPSDRFCYNCGHKL